MRIARMAHALVLVLVGLTVSVLARSDAAAPPEPLHIAYLGRISAAEDPVFRRYQAQLGLMPAELRERVVLHHLPALQATHERIDEAVTEALRLRPALIVAPSSATARALRERGADVPVVFTSFTDPVQDEIVSSTAARAEPFTGVWMADDLDPKRLEILRDAYPGIRRVAVLMDPVWAQNTQAEHALPAFGRGLGLDVRVLLARNADEALRLLDAPEARGIDAWCVPPTGLANLSGAEILARLRAAGRPLIMGYARDVEQGAPLSYMADNSFRWPAMMELTTRVLQGERPGAIPVQRPYKTILAARPAAAGFPPPSPQVVQRADLIYR